MTRVKGGTVARARRKKVLKEAKGYFGSKHRLYKTAHEQVMHSGVYAFRDRKQNKRNFRKLWITRINAGCRENEISYSRFIDGLNKAGVTVNRKMLSELAIDNPKAFANLVVIAKDALNGKTYTPKKVVVKEEVKEKRQKDMPSRLNARRKIMRKVNKVKDTDGKVIDVPAMLFNEIAPKYAGKNVGGYTRIVKAGPRRGDGAEVAILQLI